MAVNWNFFPVRDCGMHMYFKGTVFVPFPCILEGVFAALAFLDWLCYNHREICYIEVFL